MSIEEMVRIENTDATPDLSIVSDEIIISEAADRLQRAFKRQFGIPMNFGSFEFVFHNGQFQKVEEHFKNRRYVF